MDNAITTQEWYGTLVDDCKAILVERFYNSNFEAIAAYGEVGQRIIEDNNYNKFGKGNRVFNLKLFSDIKIGERTGYYCLQFYEKKLKKDLDSGKYQDVCTAVQTIYPKNITWNKVRAELPDIKKELKIQAFIDAAPTYLENDDIKIYNDDFKNVAADIQENSVDLILTDPPYPEEFLPLWEQMFEVADRILKPSRFLVCYANHQNLDAIFRLKNNLKYYWTFKLDFTLKPMAMGRNLIATWKPVLIYQKLPFKKIVETIEDNVKELTPFDNEQRDMHDDNWGQSVGKVEYLMDKFSEPGELVFEPFAGTGTTLVAAKNLKRKCIGAEINDKYIDLIKGRLA